MVITVHSRAGGRETMVITVSSVFYHHSRYQDFKQLHFYVIFCCSFHGFPAPARDSLAESTVITMLSQPRRGKAHGKPRKHGNYHAFRAPARESMVITMLSQPRFDTLSPAPARESMVITVVSKFRRGPSVEPHGNYHGFPAPARESTVITMVSEPRQPRRGKAR